MKKYCQHAVPIDDTHFCNKCHKEYKPKGLTYKEVIKRFDEEIEGLDYMLNNVEWRKERFIENYGKKLKELNDKD